MRVFKARTFELWAGKAGVTDGALLNAVAHMERGLIDAGLGGNLFKQRVALPGRGKTGSTRTIVATRFAGMLFFLYRFEKSDRDNISNRELLIMRDLASELLGFSGDELATALARKILLEISHEQND